MRSALTDYLYTTDASFDIAKSESAAFSLNDVTESSAYEHLKAPKELYRRYETDGSSSISIDNVPS